MISKGLPCLWLRADVWLLTWCNDDIFLVLFEKSVGERVAMVLSTFPNESWVIRDKNHGFHCAFDINEV